MLRNVLLLFLIIFLAGCNLPTRSLPEGTPTTDVIATQVSQLMTSMPTETIPAPPATPTMEPVFTDTPVPATATPAPTLAAASATATLAASDPKSSLGAPAWRDTLDNGKLFYLYENDNTRVTAENGALVLTGITANGWLGWSLTYSKPSQNFYLEAVMSPQTCSGSDLYGLVFRAADTESGYFFGVTCDGKYSLHARNFADGTDVIIIESTANGAIQAGSNVVNRLGVMANGDRIGLYANGLLLQGVNDSTFSKEGYFGAFVAANVTPEFTVKMDEIAIWNLPGY